MNLLWASFWVLFASGLAVGALLLVRRWSPHGGHFGDTSRAAGVFAILATSFAVLFAFVVFLAFGSYNTSSSNAQSEAQAVGEQFEAAQLLPAADGPALTAELQCYARSVVYQEWPEMARGHTLNINEWSAALFLSERKIDPVTPTQQAAFSHWLDLTTLREQSRNDRALGEDGVIPSPLWFVLLISAGMVWGFVFLFADRGEGAFVQAVLIASVTAMLVSGMLLIRFLDHPYNPGSGSLKPTAMEQLLVRMDEGIKILKLDVPDLCDANGQRR